MVWDNTKPSNQERIQNLGNAIRPNWIAIEQASDNDADADKLKVWAINLINRSQPAVTGPDTPDRIGDNIGGNTEAGIIYCRNDGSENELFFEDSQNSSNEIQLTQDGKIGSKTTQAVITDVTFGTDTLLNNQDAMVVAWSSVVVVGSAISTQTNYGMSWTRTSTGRYKATFTANQVTNANYVVIGTAFTSGGGTEATVLSFSAPDTKDTSEFSIRLKHGKDDSLSDRSFYVAVFGGR